VRGELPVLPPEVNSLRIFGGAGPGPMLAAAAAWDGLAVDLGSAAASFGSVISALTEASWQGPAAVARRLQRRRFQLRPRPQFGFFNYGVGGANTGFFNGGEGGNTGGFNWGGGLAGFFDVGCFCGSSTRRNPRGAGRVSPVNFTVVFRRSLRRLA
jgi:hypothetical protein